MTGEMPPQAGSLQLGARGLPSGTLTMLFTDIEGSTGLLTRLGDRYGEALSAQRTHLRDAIGRCRGREMGTEGDSFFVVFESARDAVRCCVTAQQALAGHDWPDGVPVRVRMGLHSGEPARHEDGYIGLDVHRAARIAATAHGSQIVMSEATRHLAQARLPEGVTVRDLGWHRLKDIEAPERIFQVVTPGLPDRFPPLRSLGAQSRLPVPLTPLVGRQQELEQVRAAVSRPGIRLVTLTGTGGVGKTRLALAAAASLDQQFPHGVFFIPLAAVHDGEVMWKAIAGSLGVSADGPEVVTGYLGDRPVLLVLDNLEQLHGSAEVVAELLAAAPGLIVLATSRRPLHLLGEQEQPVPPLQLPSDVGAQEVAACEAARLFVQHASLARPGFSVTDGNAADIAAICRRLDGLPLAIELAASRVRLLSPHAILGRLGRSLDLAAGNEGQPSRQQNLRATITWSYDLLRPSLAEAFRRAGVFAGGCDLDALAAIASAGPSRPAGTDPLELAAGLHDVSLITVTESADGEPRLGMLETIRAYALERLAEAGDLDQTSRRHAHYYAGVAERADERLRGLGQAHLSALDRLEAEHDNLRAALAWSLEPPAEGLVDDTERAATGMRLAQALGAFWYQHGHATEGRRWLQRAIDLAAVEAGAPLANISHLLAMLLTQLGELEMALLLFERSLAIWRDLGDRDHQAQELSWIGGTYRRLDDLDKARRVLAESVAIARKIRNEFRLTDALTNLGQLESIAGNFNRATEVLHESLALNRKLGDVKGAAVVQQSLAVNSLLAGRAVEARDLQAGIVSYVASSGDIQWLIDVLEVSAAIAAELGACSRAARLAGAAETVRQEAGMPDTEEDAALLERFLAPARATVASEEWNSEITTGRALSQEQALTLLMSPFAADDTLR